MFIDTRIVYIGARVVYTDERIVYIDTHFQYSGTHFKGVLKQSYDLKYFCVNVTMSFTLLLTCPYRLSIGVRRYTLALFYKHLIPFYTKKTYSYIKRFIATLKELQVH